MSKRIAAVVLAVVFAASLLPGWTLGGAPEEQNRHDLDQPPSWHYPLGTDQLGRNRLARVLGAARTSLLLAPLAAAASVAAALLFGSLAAMLGGAAERLFEASTDLLISLPWLFVLMAARAALPLDTSPAYLTLLTFAFLAALAWAAPARVVRSAVVELRQQDFYLHARSLGCAPVRSWFLHLLPNLRRIAAAQFWTCIPVFIVGEANLGLLGLGVPEPAPSLGNLLRELQGYGRFSDQPWLIAPVILLVTITSSLWALSRSGEEAC